MIKFFTPIVSALALIAGAFFIGKDYGSKSKEAECQKTEIATKNVEIKIEQKKVKIKTYQNEVSQKDSDITERKRWIELFEQERANSDAQ